MSEGSKTRASLDACTLGAATNTAAGIGNGKTDDRDSIPIIKDVSGSAVAHTDMHRLQQRWPDPTFSHSLYEERPGPQGLLSSERNVPPQR